MNERRPIHLAVLMGVSAGVYAVSLAGVTALQSAADARLHAERHPIRLAADVVGATHDDLDAAIDDATRRYLLLAARYDAIAPQVGDLETTLDALTARADEISDTAQSLPTRISLPAVRTSVPAPASRPTTHATTGASG